MLNDQKPRHDCSPVSLAAKLARARAYLRERNIDAVQQGNVFRYQREGCRVLLRGKIARVIDLNATRGEGNF